MTDQTDPKWTSGDPQRWETYWEAWYQIVGAEPVRVSLHERTEQHAHKVAEEALKDALDKVVELGLKVEASSWTVKWRTRRQEQRFDPTNVREYVITHWSGRLRQVLKSLATSGGDR